MGIQYQESVKIFGIHFTNTIHQTTLKSWTTVTDGIHAHAQETYSRELNLHQRLQYVHNFLLARAWFMAQIFPLRRRCERQINTTIAWLIWRGVIFRVPLSTLQRRKQQGGLGLINIAAKCRTLMHCRIQEQSQECDTLAAIWFREWNIQIVEHNSPQIQRLPKGMEYMRQYVADRAYITQQGAWNRGRSTSAQHTQQGRLT
jgi:hypothetical protein